MGGGGVGLRGMGGRLRIWRCDVGGDGVVVVGMGGGVLGRVRGEG